SPSVVFAPASVALAAAPVAFCDSGRSLDRRSVDAGTAVPGLHERSATAALGPAAAPGAAPTERQCAPDESVRSAAATRAPDSSDGKSVGRATAAAEHAPATAEHAAVAARGAAELAAAVERSGTDRIER